VGTKKPLAPAIAEAIVFQDEDEVAPDSGAVIAAAGAATDTCDHGSTALWLWIPLFLFVKDRRRSCPALVEARATGKAVRHVKYPMGGGENPA
jgi:hypothetical protein